MRFVRANVFCTATVAIVLFGVSGVAADEFEVGILLELVDVGSQPAEFVEGFQLAVDQSPDVSHPPGVEGGDHLGSMDVVFVLADGSDSEDGLVGDAVEMGQDDLVPVVIAYVSADTLEIIVGPVTGSKTMLIAASASVPNDFSGSQYFFAIGEGTSALALLNDRQPDFTQAYRTAYQSEPTSAAIQGYLAGRLVDIAVAATDRDPYDAQKLAAAFRSALGETPSSDPDLDVAVSSSDEFEESSSWLPGPLTLGFIALGGMVGALILIDQRRRSAGLADARSVATSAAESRGVHPRG